MDGSDKWRNLRSSLIRTMLDIVRRLRNKRSSFCDLIVFPSRRRLRIPSRFGNCSYLPLNEKMSGFRNCHHVRSDRNSLTLNLKELV